MIQWDDTHDEQLRAMSDDELRAAYERTDGAPGNPEADTLAAEMKRRQIEL